MGGVRSSDGELADYHREQVRFAGAFGVPEDLVPATPAAFAAYWERMLAGELRVTEAARDVARHTLRPPAPRAAAPGLRRLRAADRGAAPALVRAGYGLEWGPRRERALAAATAVSRRTLPLVPGPLRWFPEARRAARTLVAQRDGRVHEVRDAPQLAHALGDLLGGAGAATRSVPNSSTLKEASAVP